MTYDLPGDFWDNLKEVTVERVVKNNFSHKDLLKQVKGAEVLVSLLTDKVDAGVMDAAGDSLKMIANYAVGFNNIDVDEATKRGIVVTNTPGVLTEAVAEHIMALMLTLNRRIMEGDAMVRQGKYHGWKPDLLIGESSRDKVFGVVGLGRIGRWSARLAKGLGMKVIYNSNSRDEEFEEAEDVKYHELETLLAKADVVSLSVPLCDETFHLIGTKELALMKPTAMLINTARGSVVDEKALVKALKNRVIRGAALDVFEDETQVNKDLRKLHNTVLTPHIASATVEARLAMSKLVYENVRDFLAGKKPEGLVNQGLWKEEA